MMNDEFKDSETNDGTFIHNSYSQKKRKTVSYLVNYKCVYSLFATTKTYKACKTFFNYVTINTFL